MKGPKFRILKWRDQNAKKFKIEGLKLELSLPYMCDPIGSYDVGNSNKSHI